MVYAFFQLVHFGARLAPYITLALLLIFIWGYRKKIHKLLQAALLVNAIAFALLSYMSYIEPYLLTTRLHTVEFSKNPEKVIHAAFIADFHLSPYKKRAWIQKIVDELNKHQIDIVLIGGDFVTDVPKDKMKEYFEPLKDIQAPLGVFAVIGNHDCGGISKWSSKPNETDVSKELISTLETLNITFIHNTSTIIDNTINLIGVDSLWCNRDNTEQAFKGINKELPSIVLAHNPDILLKTKRQANLWLFGHTHGGQVRFPFVGAVHFPTTLPYDKGPFTTPNGDIYVTSGLGETGAPIRLLNIPEIVIMKIKQ